MPNLNDEIRERPETKMEKTENLCAPLAQRQTTTPTTNNSEDERWLDGACCTSVDKDGKSRPMNYKIVRV